MKRNNFIALILAVMIVISAAFCAGAAPDTGAAQVTSAQYRIPVKGNRPISNEPEYVIKVMSFDVTYNGSTEKLSVVVSKADQKEPRLAIMNSGGTLVNMDESAYCYSRKSNELASGEFFTVTIKGGKLITACDGDDATRDMLMIKGVTFANVELFNGAYDVAVGSAPSQTQPQTQPGATTEDSQTEDLTAQPEEEPSTQENKQHKKGNGIGWLILAIAAVVVAFGCLAAFIVLNKKSSDRASKPQIQSGRVPAVSYTPPRRTKAEDEVRTDALRMNYNENGDIPVSRRRTESEIPLMTDFEMYNIEVKYPQPYTATCDMFASAPQAEENEEQ